MFELGFFDSLFWCVGFACIPLLIILLLKGKNLFLTLASVLSAVVIAINLSLAVDAKWMAFLNDFVKDWTTVHDYVFYFTLLIDVASAVLLLFSKTTQLHKKIFGVFAILNLALVLSSNVFNFYTCGVNYHLFNQLPTQTAQLLALICTFILYLRLIATAGLTLTLVLVKTNEQKQQKLDEVKEEILDIVDACKDALHQQKQQEEFKELSDELKNDKELNDLLDQIDQELAKAEQEIEQPQEQPKTEQSQIEQPQVEEVKVEEQQPEQQVEEVKVEEQQEIKEEPKTEEINVEQPKVEEPKVAEPQAEIKEVKTPPQLSPIYVEEIAPLPIEEIKEEPKTEQPKEEVKKEPKVEEVKEQPKKEQSLKDLTLIKEFEVQPATQLITATDTTEERTTQTVEIVEEKIDPNDQTKKETVVVATTATAPKKSTPKKSSTTKSTSTKSSGTKSTTKKSTTTKKTDSKPPIKKFVSYIVKSESIAEAPNMYCQYCGTKVHSDSQICPRCFNQMTHLYLCKNCHTLNSQTICENCGEKLD